MAVPKQVDRCKCGHLQITHISRCYVRGCACIKFERRCTCELGEEGVYETQTHHKGWYKKQNTTITKRNISIAAFTQIERL